MLDNVADHICAFLIFYIPGCVEYNLSDLIQAEYTYTVGDAPIIISKPLIQRDGCSTDCDISFTNHDTLDIITEYDDRYEISTSDVSLVSQQDSIQYTEIEFESGILGLGTG